QGHALASAPLLGDLAYRASANVVHSHTTTIALKLELTHLVGHEAEQNMGNIDYCIFVNTNHIFDYLLDDQTEETVRVAWPQWGTRATRWFIDSDALSADSIDAFGSLYPIWDLDHHTLGMGQHLSIFEFNPQIVRRHMQASGSIDEIFLEGREFFSDRVFSMADLKAPLVSVYNADTSQDIVTAIVGSDRKTVMNDGFEEPVESSLPFMVVTRAQLLPRHQGWHIQGDYLVGIPMETIDNPGKPLSLYKLQFS
ncbi:hypothetical protein RSAG8_09590, partial [Rhizoctonia solani AG-8 WAC10335]